MVAAGVYFAVAVASGSAFVWWTGLVTSLYAVAVLVAMRFVHFGAIERPVLLVSYGLLVTVVLAAPAVAFAYPTLVVVALVALAMPLPFLPPRRIRRVAAATLAVVVYVLLVGVWREDMVPLPDWAHDVLVVSTLFVCVYVLTYLVVRVHDRMQEDIAERKRTEAALRKEQEGTHRAYERARAAERRKDEFLAILGHELRNPLAPIVTALELMRASGQEAFGREREVIERQVRHMTRLVDDLLDVSRITRGKLELRRRRVELADVVHEAVETMAPALEQRNVEVDVPSEGCSLWADPARLTQVVSNLLSNAARYTAPGGHIAVRAERAGGDVRIEVADDGAGMTSELLEHVFDPFVQGPQHLHRPKGGLGLGLPLVRSLVEMHGGRVEAHSSGPGSGSCFVVTLPATERVVAQAPARPHAPAGLAGAHRILVVDDNEDAAELLSRALTRRGFDVRVAHDGPEALRVAGEFLPDAAVLDIGLPIMDGYELAECLRRALGEGLTRLVAVTGYGQPSDRARSAKAGFDAHLVKPVELTQLERCLG